jgi:hypothetical protein
MNDLFNKFWGDPWVEFGGRELRDLGFGCGKLFAYPLHVQLSLADFAGQLGGDCALTIFLEAA